ncbi:kinesin-related protein 4-like [Mercenaria mercenaria]|uniref:kinesin-related protein 4-like n=1 Tax=Mercenaria mercenaria TaxID=6596 RepID=UPI00234FA830|nr:kinesin-related protein 4-like [Mercenaria mercenaria]XP_053393982.1 kinesin-related protein 4-like [Mercenaria mercenaria]
MSTTTRDSDSDDDTLTSSDCSESSDNESSEHDRDDTSDTASYRSLAFSVKKNRSTAIVKSKKSKKRVRFKPGDSLVLIYVIPNREMLGLKSDSEDSDYGDSDDESDDEEDDDDDDDEDEDDDEDNDEDNDDDSENDDDSNNKMNKNKAVKPKPFAKLLAVKQVNRHKIPDLRSNIKRAQEKPKPISLDLNSNPAGSRIKQRLKPRKKEKKDVPKSLKKESTANTISKTKQSKNKKNKSNSIKVDVNKTTKTRKNRPRLLEIRATVEADSKNSETQASVQKVVHKNDIKPNVIDVNDSVCLNSSKHLTNRTRLQPTSFRITKPRPDSGETKGANSLSERSTKVAQVVSASYESLSSVLPSSYINLNSIQNHTVEETIRRLDPESMNTSGKRNYAWQVANGTISSQSLRTPSILPFWDSLQNSVAENNTIKLPT